jgi:hypothetical protein
VIKGGNGCIRAGYGHNLVYVISKNILSKGNKGLARGEVKLRYKKCHPTT